MDNKNERQWDEQKKRERIEVDKIKQGKMENIYAKEYEKYVPLTPKTFKQKYHNFWFHHRVTVFVITLFVVIAGYFVVDLITRPNYDTTVVLAAEGVYNFYQEAFEGYFNQYADDYNADGKTMTCTAVVSLKDKDSRDAKNEFAIANKSKLTGMLASCEHSIFLLDDVGYEHISDVNDKVFEDLSKLYPKNPRVKKDRYYVKGTDLEKYLIEKGVAPEHISDTLSICVRSVNNLPTGYQDKYKASYEKYHTLVDKIIATN